MAWTRLLPSWETGEKHQHQRQRHVKVFAGNVTDTKCVLVLTQGDVCDDTAKYKRREKRQGDDEAVEKAVIAFSHTVSHPWTVVIKSFWRGKESKEGIKLQSLISVTNYKSLWINLVDLLQDFYLHWHITRPFMESGSREREGWLKNKTKKKKLQNDQHSGKK